MTSAFGCGGRSTELRRVYAVRSACALPMTPTGFLVSRKRYGIINVAFDVILVCLTAGFWLIWIFVREMRHR